MVVTATQFKMNLGHYLSNVAQEEITISKNGMPIARLVSYKEYISDSLVGVLGDADLTDGFDGDYRKLIQEMTRMVSRKPLFLPRLHRTCTIYSGSSLRVRRRLAA